MVLRKKKTAGKTDQGLKQQSDQPLPQAQASSQQVVPYDRRDLSVLNTTGDIAAILMQEFATDESLSKEAVFHLAEIYLSQKIDPNEPKLLETALQDVVEYLLLVGNAVSRISIPAIDKYIALKADIEKKDSLYTGPNKRFKEIMADAILTIDPDPRNLFYEVRENMSSVYRGVMMGVPPVPVPEEKLKRMSYLYPQVEKASRALLLNFPLLQRVELNDYNDIVATLELATILPQLETAYKDQITGHIEERIYALAQERRKRARERSDNPDIAAASAGASSSPDLNQEPQDLSQEKDPNPYQKKCYASELLFQARAAILISQGIEPMCPRIGTKHFTDSDYEAAVISAVSLLDKRNIFMHDFEERKYEMDFAFLINHYQSKEVYLYTEMQHKRHFQNKRETLSKHDFESQIDTILKASHSLLPSLSTNDETMLRKMLYFSMPEFKFDVGGWGELFNQHGAELANYDPFGFLILASSVGMHPHCTYKDIGTEEGQDDLPVEKRRRKLDITIHGIGIRYFDSHNPLGSQLRRARLHDGYSPDLYDGEMYFQLPGFPRVVNALLAAYVNNKILGELRYRSDFDLNHLVQWNSPLIVNCDYSPDDRAIASSLMERYPVFSMIPVMQPEDIPNGIILHNLQEMTGRQNIDTTATITQNLFVRQIYALNLMAGQNVRKEEN